MVNNCYYKYFMSLFFYYSFNLLVKDVVSSSF